MKIGIDVGQVVHEGTGVATYTEELVRALIKMDKSNDYVFFGTSLRKFSWLTSFGRGLKSESGKITTRFFPIPPKVAEPVFNVFPRPRLEFFTGKLDVYHSSDWLEPRAVCPKVTVVHDLAMFKFPEVVHPEILAIHKRKLRLVKKESRLVIAVSQSTRRDLVELLGFDSRKIMVVYEAVDSKFHRVDRDTVGTTAVLNRYGINTPYILALGTREPRKNLKRIIEAFTLLGDENLKLVIVGKFGWGEDIRLRKNVILAGYVPQNDLPRIYSSAEVFVYPSLYEGFGLPVLEAMKCGVPVVTSRISSLPEVAGEAAVLVNPYEVEDIVEGIKFAMMKHAKLVSAGLIQVKKFSWEETARQTLGVYVRAAGGKV